MVNKILETPETLFSPSLKNWKIKKWKKSNLKKFLIFSWKNFLYFLKNFFLIFCEMGLSVSKVKKFFILFHIKFSQFFNCSLKFFQKNRPEKLSYTFLHFGMTADQTVKILGNGTLLYFFKKSSYILRNGTFLFFPEFHYIFWKIHTSFL